MALDPAKVLVGYTGYVKVDGVQQEFGKWKLDPKYGHCPIKTMGDLGFDQNVGGRASATLEFETPATGELAGLLEGRVMYAFTLSLGTDEDGDEVTLPSLSARITGAPVEVDATKDEECVMLRWTAAVSGQFTLTPV